MLNYMAIASIFGPILVITGIWTLLYQYNIKKIIESLGKNPALLYVGGFLNLIMGLTIINSFNVWIVNREILVTLLGWLLFLRGLVIYFLPNAALKIVKMQENTYVFSSMISIIWGLALCWLAFM